jgi:hypothetical protein
MMAAGRAAFRSIGCSVLDLAAVAEDALEGRSADGITTTTTLDEAR